jgi:hypothetical protein
MNRTESARERWARIIREQGESGLSVAAFCVRRGIAVSSFYPWKRRLAAMPAFVEAVLDGDERGRECVVVELAGRRRVIVGPGFDRRLLLEVIGALEQRETGAEDAL